MMLHALERVRRLTSDEKSLLIKSMSRVLIHEAGHAVALRRYDLAPYCIRVSAVSDEAVLHPPQVYNQADKDYDLLLCAGALMEQAVFGKWTVEGIAGDAQDICKRKSIPWNGHQTTLKILNQTKDRYPDFPRDDEIEVAIKIHDIMQTKWGSAPVHNNYKIFFYRSIRPAIKTKSWIRDKDLLIQSVYNEGILSLIKLVGQDA